MRIIAFRTVAADTPPLPPNVSAAASREELERLVEEGMALRRSVFVDEQGVDPAIEFDGLDAHALHLVALDDERVVAVARLLTEGDRVRIGRMAVCAERRGTGIGAVLGEAALACARRLGASEAYLHAQAHAVPFYAALGFIAVGDGFEEAGIPHVAMRRILARTGDPD